MRLWSPDSSGRARTWPVTLLPFRCRGGDLRPWSPCVPWEVPQAQTARKLPAREAQRGLVSPVLEPARPLEFLRAQAVRSPCSLWPVLAPCGGWQLLLP